MSNIEFWRGGYVDDDGFMRCSCGCGGFTVERHADKVKVTEEGRPLSVETRSVYRCDACRQVVIPLENPDLPQEEPPPAL